MADYTKTTWVDDDGSGTVGTIFTAARMNKMEDGIQDAAQHIKSGTFANLLTLTSYSAQKGWLYLCTDVNSGELFYCDGTQWLQCAPGVTDASLVQVGSLMWTSGIALPTGYLRCRGGTVSRTTYSNLFNALTFTCSVTRNGTSAVTVSAADALLITGAMKVEGTGITAGTDVTSVSGTTVNLSAAATGSGTATWRFFIWGRGDGSTTFGLPDMRNIFPMGSDQYPGAVYTGKTGGSINETLALSQIPAHDHGLSQNTNTTTGGSGTRVLGGGSADVTGSRGGGGSHNNMPPYQGIDCNVKY